MKTKISFLVTVLAGCFFYSCEKSPELMYTAANDGINIWLGTSASSKPDSTEFNFAFKPVVPTDSIVFTGMLLGQKVEHDRKFILSPVGGDTDRVKEGVHYAFGEYVIKANTYTGTFPIYVKRTGDFKAAGARIVFGISAAGDLKKGLTENSKITVIFKEEFSKPANWDADIYPYNKLSTYFGVYSDAKFEFITTVIGKPPVFRVLLSGTVGANDIDFTTVSYYKSSCVKRLSTYNAANPGNPLRDENNNLITFP
ncbi:DUF4843 domain-containing protein [Chitinophaga sp. sic0106]|uniref:DUF4843 domain-containing protein n=1 Tax=Chitinophaga sp. sic0106 TaxID=2854785 RepID=UPI001C4436EF|nr:DUF4843 domain-containing protein [Chitinophaga sp. sic0106]MBV7533450.1 DUF4843 domain-containing protein [Chitinophaga sp. sic0106]